MNKTEIVKRIKVLLQMDVTLEQYTDAGGTEFEAEALEAGKVLWLLTPDGQVAASPGKYRFGNLEVLIQDGGVIEEVIELELVEEPEPTADPEPAVEASEDTPPAEEEPTVEAPEAVTLEQYNAVIQRVTDLEEVIETLTDALAKFITEDTELEEVVETPTPVKKVEASEETPKQRGSTVNRVFSNLQFTDG